jgi:hypothetical protein
VTAQYIPQFGVVFDDKDACFAFVLHLLMRSANLMRMFAHVVYVISPKRSSASFANDVAIGGIDKTLALI